VGRGRARRLAVHLRWARGEALRGLHRYRKTLQELAAQPREVSRDVPAEPRKPRGLQDDIDKVVRYLEGPVGGPYVAWPGGPFTRRAPAWVRPNTPPAGDVRREGMFRAAALTLSLEVLGLPLPIPSDPEWEGGVLDYGRDYVRDMKIAEPYRPGMETNLLDLFIVEYTGPALADQGHLWFKGKGDKCFQADVPFGINARRTLEETIRFASHGKRVWIIRRERWMRKGVSR
jgi:hypothetical protein